MMVQVETHCHTAETSSCGRVPAAKIVADYKKAGYRMLITTDHYYERMWERPELAGRDWQEKMDAYMRGYRAAGPQARPLASASCLPPKSNSTAAHPMIFSSMA